jgi:hypothetical protein
VFVACHRRDDDARGDVQRISMARTISVRVCRRTGSFIFNGSCSLMNVCSVTSSSRTDTSIVRNVRVIDTIDSNDDQVHVPSRMIVFDTLSHVSTVPIDVATHVDETFERR